MYRLEFKQKHTFGHPVSVVLVGYFWQVVRLHYVLGTLGEEWGHTSNGVLGEKLGAQNTGSLQCCLLQYDPKMVLSGITSA